MNAALGFDTFLVICHGARASSTPYNGSRLGYYYRSNIAVPLDSLTDPTSDQMCTVTRPDLAFLASIAVELPASLLQLPDGVHATAPPSNTDTSNSTSYSEDSGGSVSGLVLHKLRGILAQFRNLHIVGVAHLIL